VRYLVCCADCKSAIDRASVAPVRAGATPGSVAAEWQAPANGLITTLELDYGLYDTVFALQFHENVETLPFNTPGTVLARSGNIRGDGRTWFIELNPPVMVVNGVLYWVAVATEYAGVTATNGRESGQVLLTSSSTDLASIDWTSSTALDAEQALPFDVCYGSFKLSCVVVYVCKVRPRPRME